MSRCCVIFNPTARGDKARQFRSRLDAFASRFTLRPTDRAGAARPLAQQAVEEGFEIVVAAGGDGTVNEVINGISDVPEGWQRTSLAVVPLGTVNVFAKEFGLPTDLGRALDVVDRGRVRELDLPVATFSVDCQPQTRVFAQLAGAGLDARAIARVRWDLKKRFGPLAYVYAGFGALAERCAPLQATSSTRRASGELVLVGNGRYYGGRYRLFPEADPADGLLDVVVYPRVNFPKLLAFGWGWLTGDLHRLSGAIRWQAEAVTLTCAGAMPFELDGDNVGHLPVTFRTTGRRMRLLVL